MNRAILRKFCEHEVRHDVALSAVSCVKLICISISLTSGLVVRPALFINGPSARGIARMLENFPDKELDLFANAIKLGLLWESRELRKKLPNCSASRIMTA